MEIGKIVNGLYLKFNLMEEKTKCSNSTFIDSRCRQYLSFNSRLVLKIIIHILMNIT